MTLAPTLPIRPIARDAVAAPSLIARLRARAEWLGGDESGAWRYLAAAVVVLLGVAVSETLLLALQLSRVSTVMLASVVISATWLGGRAAFFAAGSAFVAQNIFLMQPAMQARMDSREQILTLAIFLLVALTTGSLAGRMRDAAKRSMALAEMNTRLFEASRRMSATDEEGELRRILLEEVEKLTGGPVTLASDQAPVGGDGAWRSYPMKAQAEDLGLLRWRTSASGGHENIDGTVCVLADMCAASIARARLAGHKSKLEIAAQSERLQTALLSSISHDFRTPLSAILTSASSLRAYGEQFTPETRADLATTIQEEAQRLNRFVVNLLNMIRLDAGGFKPERVSFDVHEVLDRVVRSAQRSSDKTVSVDIAEAGRGALGDPVLFELAVQNVLENALRFAARDVRIACARDGQTIAVQVSDDGPGVPAHEVSHIFDRFFSSSHQGVSVKGTGLGLSITRGLMEAMYGAADATVGPDGAGLTVSLKLPLAAP